MGAIYLEGKIWLRVPDTIRINLSGQTKPWVMSKDVSIYLLGRFGTEYALYKALEFGGEYIRNLSMDGRMTICNMAAEMGCKVAMVEPDETTCDFIRQRTAEPLEVVLPDEDAVYIRRHSIDVSALTPQVALPYSPENAVAVSEVEGTPIDQVFIGSCTNCRIEDIAVAANILRGKKVAPNVRLIVTPASRQVFLEAVKRGYIQSLVEAGAIVTNPCCGACFGGSNGLLANGERCLATTNRNFHGRMGSHEAEIYLASPATAAATAIIGKITSPEEYL
jgi:3-isopropylmalate/(R)-2-methylmalate dehydratase large subunit